MTYTDNLPSDDPRQRLFALQQKVLQGEDVSDEELREAISLLRKTRGTATSAAPKDKGGGRASGGASAASLLGLGAGNGEGEGS